MKKAIASIILIFLGFFPDKVGFAAVITGKVVDIYTQSPIIGATISVPGTDYKTTTSQNGYFSLITAIDDKSDDYFSIVGRDNLLIWQTKNPLTLDIFSILGQKIYTKSKTVLGNGELNLKILTNGIYLLRYQVNGNHESVKFIKTAQGLIFPEQGSLRIKNIQDELVIDSLKIEFTGYYSQKFSIQTEQTNYELLKIQYSSISYLNKLPRPEAFKMLQNIPFNPNFGEVESIKILYSIPDKQI